MIRRPARKTHCFGSVGNWKKTSRHAAVAGLLPPDEPSVGEADEEDEEPDAHADGALQRDGHRVHDGLSKADDHQGGDGEPFEDDYPHGARRAQPLADEGERHDGVDPQAGGQGERVVAHHAHGDGHEACDERRAGREGDRGERRPVAEAGGQDAAFTKMM